MPAKPDSAVDLLAALAAGGRAPELLAPAKAAAAAIAKAGPDAGPAPPALAADL